MKQYQVAFIGRRAGALGVRSTYSIIVEAADTEAAKLATYDRGYEHISFLTISELNSKGQDHG